MKIVILEGHTVNPGDLSWAGFEALGQVTLYARTPPEDTAEIIRRIGDAEVAIINKTPVGEEVLAACPNLKYIGVLATGYNVVDTAAATAHGVVVTNIPTYGTAAVAQFTIGLLLEICGHIGHHNHAVHAGRWAQSPDFCFWDYPLMELAGKTMGIIGFGRIGQATARIAAALGMRVLATGSRETAEGRALADYVDLDTLLASSHVVSLHCPLTPENTGFINRDAIAKMKDGAILLNTARGPLVNEAHLAEALDSGKLLAAGVDVVSAEPIKADNPLLAAKNCFITPHIAWAPLEARARLMDVAVANLKAFIAGAPANVVNP